LNAGPGAVAPICHTLMADSEHATVLLH